MRTSKYQRDAVAKWRLNHIEKVRKTQASVACKFSRLRVVARRRGVACMSLEEYKILVQRQCHYCGFELPEFGYGIDRVLCTGGYELNNCVPCCDECNITKSNHFTEEEMMLLGDVINKIKLARKKL